MDRWMDGQIDGWMDGWIDGWIDGWMEFQLLYLQTAVLNSKHIRKNKVCQKVSNIKE